jgi:hypothetical protein
MVRRFYHPFRKSHRALDFCFQTLAYRHDQIIVLDDFELRLDICPTDDANEASQIWLLHWFDNALLCRTGSVRSVHFIFDIRPRNACLVRYPPNFTDAFHRHLCNSLRRIRYLDGLEQRESEIPQAMIGVLRINTTAAKGAVLQMAFLSLTEGQAQRPQTTNPPNQASQMPNGV